MAAEQIDIGRLLAVVTTADNQGKAFSVFARITGIERRNGWCYWGCDACSKKLDGSFPAFHCHICSNKPLYPILKYAVHVPVVDQTGCAELVLCDREVEQLVGIPAMAFAGGLGAAGAYFPEELSKLIGKSCLFKVRVTPYNLGYGCGVYLVTKILAPRIAVVDEVVPAGKNKVPSVMVICRKAHGGGGKMVVPRKVVAPTYNSPAVESHIAGPWSC